MTDEQTTVEQRDDWAEEPDDFEEPEPLEELPRRPRRQLLGAGADPKRLALLAVLLTACGFVAGVLVEKGQSSSSSTTSAGLASRLAGLRSTAASGGRGGSFFSGSGGAGLFSGSGGRGGGAGATAGQVAYVSGGTLYVTTAEGATVKVTTSAASTVTKTVKGSVKGIRPGETVIVTGSTGANGAVQAESIRVSEAGGLGAGGLGALFGGARGGGGGASSGGSGGGEAASGGPALFGK